MPDAEGIEPTAVAIIHRPATRMVMEEWQSGDVVLDNRGNLYARASERDAGQGYPWGYVSGATRTVDGQAWVPEGSLEEGFPVRPLTLLVREGRPVR
ncbi:hypothetical protein ACWEQG_01755 [Microbispora sp. NPDC004025]